LAGIEDFALERYFARWEFAVRHQLSASDVEAFALPELLALADDDAKARWNALSLGYTESLGLPALREEIARTYDSLESRHVLVVAGAEEGIFLTMHALLASGDEAVVVTPAYQSLHAVARAVDARVTLVPLRPESGWQLDVDDVERVISPRTRVIAINFPHNPTGAHIAPDVQRRLVEIAASANAVLFSDEVYRGLEYQTRETLPAAADLSPKAVSLGVMSKAYALAGLRIGWIATRNTDLLDRVARLKDYTTICCSAPSEILALIALRARERVLARSREIVGTNLRHAGAFVAAHGDQVEWTPPRAGSVAFPRFTRLNADVVSTDLAERESTLMLPGSVFGYDSAHFRLGLGRRDFPLALEKLGNLLHEGQRPV
jgi:aspartate/methionine/tyrosine aminotransferase